jgi:hypothetical protein
MILVQKRTRLRISNDYPMSHKAYMEAKQTFTRRPLGKSGNRCEGAGQRALGNNVQHDRQASERDMLKKDQASKARC